VPYTPKYSPGITPYVGKAPVRTRSLVKPLPTNPVIVWTWEAPKKSRRRRIKHKHLPQEWYIWNPVPQYETIFEYQLGLKQTKSKGPKLPKVKMPKINWGKQP